MIVRLRNGALARRTSSPKLKPLASSASIRSWRARVLWARIVLINGAARMLLSRVFLSAFKKAMQPLRCEISREVEILLRRGSKTPTSQYYLSPHGQRAVGPFPMCEIKWMIRCSHLSPDVLIRAEDESLWASYRYHVSQAAAGRALGAVITLLRRVGVIARAERPLTFEG